SVANPAVYVPRIPRQRELIDERDAEEIAREVGSGVSLHGTGPDNGPPDAERDGGLRHVPQHPDRDRGAILEIHEPRRPDQRPIALEPDLHGASANTRRITSSIAGS